MKYETIKLELIGKVCLLTLSRPDRLNALTVQAAKDFKSAVAEAVEQGARAIVLTGEGSAFCAGGDIREMQEIAGKDGRLEAFFDEPLRILNEAILLIRQTPVPFIAAVNGVAAGGGCNLALACDLVLAAEGAKFNQAFVKIGLVPDCGGTFILPRLVGWKRAAELMFTGDMITAQRAAEMGMINSVTPDNELMPLTMKLAEGLAESPTAAIAQMKRLLDASAVNDYGSQLDLEREAQIEAGKTKDFAEGTSAFLEKRQPRFVGS
jgi:2-(1,2-epoxy-1,2-dihydrophenyl)acetyl-CoA isomerase